MPKIEKTENFYKAKKILQSLQSFILNNNCLKMNKHQKELTGEDEIVIITLFKNRNLPTETNETERRISTNDRIIQSYQYIFEQMQKKENGEKYVKLLLLKYGTLEKYSCKEIAEKLNISLTTLKRHTIHAINAFSEELRKLSG